MRTAQVQADPSDPEGILGVLKALQSDVVDLQEKCLAIVELNESRGERINKCAELSDRISEQLTDFLCHAETTETVIHEDSMALSSSNRDIEQLLNVQDRIESMNGDEVPEVSDSDLDSEQRLIGFVANELSSKIEELSKFRQRLTDANDEYKYEWDQFRHEVRQYTTGMSSLETQADHLQELHLARFAGEETGTDDSELIFRLVEHHMNKITHRKLQRELAELQMTQKDLEDEIGSLMTQKQSLWKRYLDLEHCLEGKKDSSEDNNLVRPTAAFSNLLDVIDGKFHPSMTHDLEQVEEDEKHGLYLHKCVTDINVKLNFSDDESDTEADGDACEELMSKKLPGDWATPTGSNDAPDDNGDETDSQNSSSTTVRNKIFNHMEEVPPEIAKLRQRQNTVRRNSMSTKNKPVRNTIIVSDSYKSFLPAGIFKKRRASHF